MLAFQTLYAWEIGGVPIDDLLEFSWLESDEGVRPPRSEEACDFALLIVRGTMEHIAEIDGLIRSHLAANWALDRLNKASLAILRMSIYSLLYQKDTHPTIVIDEAVDIAKEFGSDDSFKFVNAVLDRINKASAAQEG